MVIQLDPRHRAMDGDLLLTTACPVECDFCVYSCTAEKKPEKWMSEETIRKVAEEYSKNDVGVRIGGGEPFYDIKKLMRCLDILLEYYKPYELLLVTSGFWGSDKKAGARVRHLSGLGLDRMVLSIDRFHQKKVPLQSIENILQASKEVGLKIVLRLSLDSESNALVEDISEVIAKHRTPFECHVWGAFGKGEWLDTSCLVGFDRMANRLYSLVAKHAQNCGAPQDIGFYLTHSAKRRQLEHACGFFPTTFPNGSVYGCSMAMKGSYMGNIMQKGLGDMIESWAATLPGYFNLKNRSCESMAKCSGNFLPSQCNFCRNHSSPETELLPEALGRFIFIAKPGMMPETTKNRTKEWLISLHLEKGDLTQECGVWLARLLDSLTEQNIRFIISKPIPKCLGIVSTKQINPKTCFECSELFSVKKGTVYLCEGVQHKKGPRLSGELDRNGIYAAFEKEHATRELSNKCVSCRYLLRHQCNGLCFRSGT